mgnify:FL=1|tara:strand:+ start:2865 stop:4511 length:1647 start_codon:yes stop_codon:yes gene_type:complete
MDLNEQNKNNTDERLNEELLDENAGFTSFPGSNTYGAGPALSGRFAAFFKSFFTTKKKRGRPSTVDPYKGDVVKNAQGEGDDNISGASMGIVKGGARLPQIEYERRRRYHDYEKMDEYPEIGSALDIYSDDATQTHLDGEMLEVNTEQQLVKDAVNDFVNETDLDKFLWDIIRNMCKYGDCFVENIVDMNNPDAGIQRLKILNPVYIYRREDRYGYLKGFIQEVPASTAETQQYTSMGRFNKGSTINLDRNQLVHFRLHTSDSNYYPYGKSICAPGVRAWKSLRMMEDAMLIYRLHRAPERRIFYIDTGNLPQTKVEMFMERIKAKFKKEKFFNNDSMNADERYNPLAAEEDFFVPIKNGMGTKIETLPGAQNLGEIDDVRYFRDKVLASMKIPKDFIVEKDKSPERKANLSQLDAKFAKAVMRVQRDVEVGLTTLIKRHLEIRKFPKSAIAGLKISLAPPSDLSEKRKLELAEQKVRVVQGVKGLMLFSDEYIYKNFYNMNDLEIEQVRVQKEAEMASQPDVPPAPGAPGAPPPGQPPEQQQPAEGV